MTTRATLLSAPYKNNIRATLLTTPYRNGVGELVAWALIPSETGRQLVLCHDKHEDAQRGDTINVRRDGSEWRAG